MTQKSILITVCRQNHIRDNWRVDLFGEHFSRFMEELSGEFAGYGITIENRLNNELIINVNSYADLLNAVRITSQSDGFINKCIGHIIGQSQNLDLFEDIKRAVNRVSFAPETVQPDESNRKVCHNCGCGC